RRHTRFSRDWSSDVCSSDLARLTLVAKAQGAKSGLLYDPDMGIDLRLSCSAAGHAWLMTLSEEEAIEAVSRQGFGTPEHFGPEEIGRASCRERADVAEGART